MFTIWWVATIACLSLAKHERHAMQPQRPHGDRPPHQQKRNREDEPLDSAEVVAPGLARRWRRLNRCVIHWFVD
ncbi:hypothetical protein MANES_04G116050v8 [Manihot esculenta]|uniref:Uncharacterized protein n=1 Tax=Manihot esculenta TaxID=3983 RepID=A0ACB7HZP2_MANES|nr:hypothetical protein MANES_04G116050v8 [Manihot esculenta]